MQPQKPIQEAVSDIQNARPIRSSLREKFFDTFKRKYPNLHVLYVLSNIIGIWSGIFTFCDSWASGVNIFTAPTPEFSPEKFTRLFILLIIGLIMLLADDLSLKELLVGRKTSLEKPVEEMNAREKYFHNFKIKYPSVSTIYTLVAIVLCWCALWGWVSLIPIQLFWRATIAMSLGFFLLYIDDLKLDEL